MAQVLPASDDHSDEDTLNLPLAETVETALEAVVSGSQRYGEVKIDGRRVLLVEIPDDEFIDEVLDLLDVRELAQTPTQDPVTSWEQAKAELGLS